MPIERKLAAIMFTDIAGYTAQMSKDEAVAISLLNKKESVLKPLIAKHNGTYVKSTGDGSLSHFNSAVDAATCAKRLQESIYDDKDLNVRVGVHLGDTIFEKGDIRGDGVNIASRLESMAIEGGVFVSKEVHDQLANQKEFDGVSLGLQSMKGVGRLIEVYGLKGDKLSEPKPSEYQDNKVTVHSDDEVPSIAIIPFENKGKEEDVFYAYGISADLISDCSSAGLIRVAGLKDIENLDYKNLQYDELASKLYVRYVSHGSLWKMGDMFQLSIELFDTKDKKVVWSDRWQEKWDNLPTIKGSLSDGLLKALDTKPNIEKIVATTKTEAYEYYLKAKHKFDKRKNTKDIILCRGLLLKSIEIDNNLIDSHMCLGDTYFFQESDAKIALRYYNQSLNISKEVNNKKNIARSYYSIAAVHWRNDNIPLSRDYCEKALNIFIKLNLEIHVTAVLRLLANLLAMEGNIDAAIDKYNIIVDIQKKLEDKIGLAYTYVCMANVTIEQKSMVSELSPAALEEINKFLTQAMEIDQANNNYAHIWYIYTNYSILYKKIDQIDNLKHYVHKALELAENLGDKVKLSVSYGDMGYYYFYIKDYENAVKYLNKSLIINQEIEGIEESIETKIYLFLCYKQLGKEYDKKEIKSLIKSNKYKTFEISIDSINYYIYQILEDTSYLETAYKQVQEKADNLEPDVSAKFLSYPIPKAIVEEWEKVK